MRRVFREFFTLLFCLVILGGTIALITSLCGLDSLYWARIAGWIGMPLYIIYCIKRIAYPRDYIVEKSDGRIEVTNEQPDGIIGIIVTIIVAVLSIV